MGDEDRRYADVVIDHLPFGEAGFRPQDLAQVRYSDLLAFYIDDLFFACHGKLDAELRTVDELSIYYSACNTLLRVAIQFRLKVE